jgi:predicted nucleotidyltransferase
MNSEIIIYQTADGLTKIDVRMEEETLWLTQAQMMDLFQSSKTNISEHISHIFEEGELVEDSVVRKYRTTGADGQLDIKSNVQNLHIPHSDKPVAFYSLDVILAVGYRVKSPHPSREEQAAKMPEAARVPASTRKRHHKRSILAMRMEVSIAENGGKCYNADMDTAVQAELDKLKELIINAIPVEQIYLFGSYAYGTPHKDSDLDLFVVLKDEVPLRDIEAAIKIRLAIGDHQSMPLDLLVIKRSRYLERKTAPTLERKIAREGILIYAA